MDTTITGLFVTTKGWNEGPSPNRPEGKTRPDGVFVLRMPLINPQGRRREPYLVTWIGQDAKTWWRENHVIGSGQPLLMTLRHPLIESGLRGIGVIHAQVLSCKTLPRSYQPQPASTSAASPSPQAHSA